MADGSPVPDLVSDTAVAAAGGGVWHAAVSDAWNVPRGPNGGYIAAVVLRAMLAELDDPVRAARSLTVHYLAPPAAGPAEIHVTVERAGRSLTTLSARMVQDGRAVVAALGAFSANFPPIVNFEAPAPQVALPEGLRAAPAEGLGIMPIAARTLTAPVFGAPPFSRAAEAVTGGWMRLAEPHPADAVAIAFYADAWLPSAFTLLHAPAPAPTIDLTIHFRGRLPHAGMAADDPVLARYVSRTSRDGFCEEDGEIWAPDGTLLAQSRQLMLLFAPR
ncbi:thioesterase family protein [Baekduia soli]|uniref:Thioesterase family protein n=1 Tax=Baekduia soli TaxID=496014 RepID=A0A5B8UAV9_9ACTN|nr:thioesterase family protein [Baekduia soli]QEC50124.1 thioesterase family protein [Baekduia soli]